MNLAPSAILILIFTFQVHCDPTLRFFIPLSAVDHGVNMLGAMKNTEVENTEIENSKTANTSSTDILRFNT